VTQNIIERAIGEIRQKTTINKTGSHLDLCFDNDTTTNTAPTTVASNFDTTKLLLSIIIIKGAMSSNLRNE
jgi:hypothetical protein